MREVLCTLCARVKLQGVIASCRSQEEQEEAWSCQRWTWPYRQAQEASRRTWKCWWSAPPQNHDGQVPSWLLRKGGCTQAIALRLLFWSGASNVRFLYSVHPYGRCRANWVFDVGLQVGMRHFNIRKNQYFQPIINLDKLWSLVGHEVPALIHLSLHVCRVAVRQ